MHNPIPVVSIKTLCLPLVLILLTGCNASVTDHYTTYQDAVNDQLFDRGWLPDLIPSNSYNISVSNNIDLNHSMGAFSFPTVATNLFISQLTPFRNRPSPVINFDRLIKKRRAQGYLIYEYTEDEFIWVFFVNRKKGHAYYNMWPL